MPRDIQSHVQSHELMNEEGGAGFLFCHLIEWSAVSFMASPRGCKESHASDMSTSVSPTSFQRMKSFWLNWCIDVLYLHMICPYNVISSNNSNNKNKSKVTVTENKENMGLANWSLRDLIIPPTPIQVQTGKDGYCKILTHSPTVIQQSLQCLVKRLICKRPKSFGE